MNILSDFSCELAVVRWKIEREETENGAAQTIDVDGTARGSFRAGGAVGPGRRHFLRNRGGNSWAEVSAGHLSSGGARSGRWSTGAPRRVRRGKRRIHQTDAEDAR